MELSYIMVQLWHEVFPSFSAEIEMPSDLNDAYRKVDERELRVCKEKTHEQDVLAACTVYWQLTQNEMQPWKHPIRSTNVGDIIVIIDPQTNVGIAAYVVAGTGFNKIFPRGA